MVKQIQGSSSYLQGSSPNLQGSNVNIQGPTRNPQQTSTLNINQSGSKSIKIGDGLNGVFWIGQDGNVWTKDNNGKYKNNGPNNGTFDRTKWRQIADWKDSDKNTGNADANANASGGGTVYPDMSGAIAILEENIKGLDPVYQAEVNRAIENYKVAEAERVADYNKTKNASDASGVTNDQTVLQARNAINKNARVASGDLMSIIGSLGMSGSTGRKALAAIADKSNEGMNDSNFTYGKNQQSILQNWNDYTIDDASYQQQLKDKQTSDTYAAEVNRAKNTKDYLGQVASNQIQGGKFDTSGTLARIANQNKIIGDYSNAPTTYTGVKPTYTAPAVSDILGQNTARFDVAAGEGTKRSAPKLVKVNEQVATGDKYGII